jgi:hypothetical protein
MLTFEIQHEYIFTGSANLIERTTEYIGRTDTFLGKFIEHKTVFYHGDIYYDGKAAFEFGTINSGHYDFVQIFHDVKSE